jgi:hypothetical protein
MERNNDERWRDGKDCGKHNTPLRKTGTMRTAPPYRELDMDKDLLECRASGQLFHIPTESVAQTESTQ